MQVLNLVVGMQSANAKLWRDTQKLMGYCDWNITTGIFTLLQFNSICVGSTHVIACLGVKISTFILPHIQLQLKLTAGTTAVTTTAATTTVVGGRRFDDKTTAVAAAATQFAYNHGIDNVVVTKIEEGNAGEM